MGPGFLVRVEVNMRRATSLLRLFIRWAATSWTLLALSACFHATPVMPAPATPEEAVEIRGTLSGTWYYVAWRTGEGQGWSDASLLGGGSPWFWSFGDTNRIRWMIEGSGAREMAWSLDGKNLRLTFLGGIPSTWDFRVEEWRGDTLVVFDYGLSRYYKLTKRVP
jgi:hypothetical protein